MGGSISVETEVGRGSTFHFSILARPATDDAGRAAAPPEAWLAGHRALLVDLPPVTLGSARSWLECRGAEGIEVSAESLDPERLVELDPDFAIVRVERASRRIARLGRWARERSLPILPVLYMDEHLSRARQSRFAESLVVPLRPATLEAALRGLFAPSQPSTGPLPASTAPPVPEGLRILVAEDNPVNQMIVLMMLEKLGLEANMAADGEEVLRRLGQEDYDVVLMDLQMPLLDGIATTQRIRQELGSPVRIVAVTANAMAEDRERCFAAGMDDYMSKPFQLETLRQALSRCRRLSDAELPSSAASTGPGSRAEEPCPYYQRCPIFPLFENEPIRRVYQRNYCFGEFEDCQRYHLASRGTMPDPRLLPDGALLPVAHGKS
jgi:CheY-like chemotaxis protein